MQETSPRPWGRLDVLVARFGILGNIPTPVGKTFLWLWQEGESRKHPHARGEDECGGGNHLTHSETSPRPWGRRQRLRHHDHLSGNIPTPVGKTLPISKVLTVLGKHPHARGEDPAVFKKFCHFLETSPRPWGRRGAKLKDSGFTRNIPTPVGKTCEHECFI